MDGWTPYFWNIRIGYELHSDDKRCENACGGIIDTANGTITSPSFPDIYPRFIFTLIIITTTVINIIITTVIDRANGTITSPSFPEIYPRLLLLSSQVPYFPGIICGLHHCHLISAPNIPGISTLYYDLYFNKRKKIYIIEECSGTFV